MRIRPGGCGPVDLKLGKPTTRPLFYEKLSFRCTLIIPSLRDKITVAAAAKSLELLLDLDIKESLRGVRYIGVVVHL